jgi:putative transposase
VLAGPNMSAPAMARRLRVQYPSARYHIINRGNFQHAVFATAGAVQSFQNVLGEACSRHGWRVHAFVVLHNHYHLALETPEPNLVEGMHWLQGTFATRLNRYHDQHGHVFQGRYKSLLVQDASYLARVIDYIHLNPVRAQLVPPASIGTYPWSSLRLFLQGTAPAWLHSTELLQSAQISDMKQPWRRYIDLLVEIATGSDEDDRIRRGALSRGWAIGTSGWRKAIARDHQHLALAPGMAADELRELRFSRWQRELETGLAESGKTLADAVGAPKGVPWKIALAVRLRKTVAAPYPWIAENLAMGSPASVRVYVSQAV